MNEKPYQFKAENFISVCCFCWPGKTVLAACPELSPTVSISHGVCKPCLANFKADLKEKKKALHAA